MFYTFKEDERRERGKGRKKKKGGNRIRKIFELNALHLKIK